MKKAKSKLVKGAKNPQLIPKYLLGRLFPESKWGPYGGDVTMIGDIISFEQGGFVASPDSRPQFSAKLYKEISHIKTVIREYSNSKEITSLEIGCGYGRHSPWINDSTLNHHAIEPNINALKKAKQQYPGVHFTNSVGGSLPYKNNTFNLIFSWTVLQHIPDEKIGTVTDEINRVAAPDCVTIITEKVQQTESPTVWGRGATEYENLLSAELMNSLPKPMENTFDKNISEETMIFRL